MFPGHAMIRRASRAAGLCAAPTLLLLFVSACSSGSGKLVALPSPVKSSQPAAVQSPGGWLAYLNFYRATAGLPPVAENTAWSDGARKHAMYIVKNDALLHSEELDNPWFTPEGLAAARQSNLFVSYNRDDTDIQVMNSWMQSPFHAVGILDPRLEQVGYGSYREENGRLETGAAMNVIAGILHTAKAAYPIFWPGDGTIIPIGHHLAEQPSPLTGCPGYTAPSGLPLILQIGSGDLTPAVSATSFTRNGRSLEHCVIDETTYNHPDRGQQLLGRRILGARDAIVLIPRAPLSSGDTYTASITVNGDVHTWSFSVSTHAP